jgi:hypothetical protein
LGYYLIIKKGLVRATIVGVAAIAYDQHRLILLLKRKILTGPSL